MQHRAALFSGALGAAMMLVLVPVSLSSEGNTIVTAAGNGLRGSSGDGSQAAAAALDQPRSIFETRDGGFVFAQPSTHTVRKVSADGTITTIAGTGSAGYSGDGGPARRARLNLVHGAAPTPDGGYVLADTLNNRIRRISPDGTITTIAGTGVAGYSGDGGPATSAQIHSPRGIAALPDGGFLIPDTDNHRIRRVWPDGIITTVAGNGTPGFAGDGGPATAAQLSLPFGVSPTRDGGFLVVDLLNHRIRKVSADGTIATVAGNGTAGFAGDGGPSTAASINFPPNVAALPDGGFLIADAANHRIRRVLPDGIITTIAGTGRAGFRGDGRRPLQARFNAPKAVTAMANGSMLVADEQNDRIRFIGVLSSPVNVRKPSLRGTPAAGDTLSVHPGGWRGYGLHLSYSWERCSESGRACSRITGAHGAEYSIQPTDVGFRLRASVTATSAAGSRTARSTATRRVTGVATRVFAVSGAASDGHAWRFESGGQLGPARSMTKGDVVVARSHGAAGTLFAVGVLRFDASEIPDDARVTAVRLQFEVTGGESADRLRLLVEPYAPSRWPVDARDFALRPDRAVVGSHDLASLKAGTTADIRLQPRSARVRGVTGLRLLTPGSGRAGTNYLYFASADHRTLPAPRLVVTYAVR